MDELFDTFFGKIKKIISLQFYYIKMYFYNGHQNQYFFIDMQRERFVEWKLYEYQLKYIKIMFNFVMYLFKKN